MELNIDRGLKSYDVKDADGTLIGTIRFNPSDIGLAGLFAAGWTIGERSSSSAAAGLAAAIAALFANSGRSGVPGAA